MWKWIAFVLTYITIMLAGMVMDISPSFAEATLVIVAYGMAILVKDVLDDR